MSRENINPADLRKEIGERIKAARTESGFTQEDLGNALGVTRVVVGMYEKGRLRVSIQLLLQLCKVLKKPIQYFVEEDAETKQRIAEAQAARPSYNLQENVRFTLEMALRSYLRMEGVTVDVTGKVDEIMELIDRETKTPRV